MAHQITLSIPDKDYLFFMNMFKKLKLKINRDIEVADSTEEYVLSKEQIEELDYRIEQHLKTPNQGSEWEAVKKRLLPNKK